MSDFICTKGLTLGGVEYIPGQDIPAGARPSFSHSGSDETGLYR